MSHYQYMYLFKQELKEPSYLIGTKQAISWCIEKTNSLDQKLLPC